MSPVRILQAALALIQDEKNWTQCKPAADGEGRPVDVLSEEAKCFCSVGAISRICADLTVSEQMAASDLLRRELGGGHSIVSFNDTHSHEDVLALFGCAIARAESEAA